ncbi:MAG: IPT/TIG domain-containing protein [Planctomycetes bacterium]|nr:IPT/TIG domain-containing protein [Planctomycetota bacterium]
MVGKSVEISDEECATYPTGNEMGFRDGILISYLGKVFVISDGKKRWVVSGDVFNNLGYKWSNVIDVTLEEYNLHEEGAYIDTWGTHPDGTLIHSAPHATVFVIDDGKRRPIASPNILLSQFTWDELVEISESEMNSYPVGDYLCYRDGCILKDSVSGKLYVVSNQEIRPISSTMLETLGLVSLEQIDTPPDELAHFPTGSPILNPDTLPPGTAVINDSDWVYWIQGNDSPYVTEIGPTSVQVGSIAYISGTSFGSSQSTSYVAFGSTKVTDYLGWSDNQVTCYVPGGLQQGTCNVSVVTEYGTSNTVEFTVTESPSPIPGYDYTYYLAEGYTGPGFEEWLCLQNYQAGEVGVHIVYMLGTGENVEKDHTLAPTSRTTISVNGEVGADREVGCTVYAKEPIVVERPMYFQYSGKVPDRPELTITGGHDVMAASSLAGEFYFAEGYTGSAPGTKLFDTYLCMLNPSDEAAGVDITYAFGAGDPQQQHLDIAPRSRYTVKVNDVVGPDREVATTVVSDHPILAERPMYFFYNNWVPGGHDVVGGTYLARTFYFAEGCTRLVSPTNGFNTFLCLGNPSGEDAQVTITYMFSQGEPRETTCTVGANSRKTVVVGGPEEAGPDRDLSIKVDSSAPIICERPMYFYQNDAYPGGHDVIGVNQPYRDFYFAEGTTRDGFEEWLCLQNPGDTTATVTITYMLGTGENIEQVVTVDPNTRNTIDVNSFVGPEEDISCRVSSDVPIVAERPMYFNYHGWASGGHCVMGDVR